MFAFGVIQQSSGAMETQVRLGILFFVILVYYVDKLLAADNKDDYLLLKTVFLIFVSTNILGTMYSFAGWPAILVVMLYDAYKTKHVRKDYIVVCSTFVVSCILYLLQYKDATKTTFETGVFERIIHIVLNPFVSIQTFCGFSAGSLLGYGIYNDHYISEKAFLLLV